MEISTTLDGAGKFRGVPLDAQGQGTAICPSPAASRSPDAKQLWVGRGPGLLTPKLALLRRPQPQGDGGQNHVASAVGEWFTLGDSPCRTKYEETRDLYIVFACVL